MLVICATACSSRCAVIRILPKSRVRRSQFQANLVRRRILNSLRGGPCSGVVRETGDSSRFPVCFGQLLENLPFWVGLFKNALHPIPGWDTYPALAPHSAGEGARPPRLEKTLRNLHFDLLGSGGFPLGDVQLEHTIVKLCVHLLGVRIVR
jgi:hypothetical protein